MNYDLILWDFDGTLADTLEGAVRIYNRLAGKYGFLPIEDVEAARAMRPRAFLKQHNISALKLPRLIREFVVEQRTEINNVRLIPGIADTLRQLQQRGIRMAILSSNAEENIRACLQTNHVADHFEFIQGYIRLLGKARAIRKLLHRHKIQAARLLYVGDDARDVEAATRAGVPIAAVTWGFQAGSQLALHSPTFLVSRPDDLLGLIG